MAGMRRSIPAHAGETLDKLVPHKAVQVDPRSRGGDGVLPRLSSRPTGRSPLTRGRPGRPLHRAHLPRSIPAHAGETACLRFRATRRRVDPRSRGGDRSDIGRRTLGSGRSPLTRGRPPRLRRPPSGGRSIPAHAGETLQLGGGMRSVRVDPRSRGGDLGSPTTIVDGGGRSPLTRGRLTTSIRRSSGRGSIPAHAGETPPEDDGQSTFEVDPRSRGGDEVIVHVAVLL